MKKRLKDNGQQSSKVQNRIVIFDPSGTSNYCNGLAEGLSERSDVTVIARDGFNGNQNKYSILEFFQLSNRLKLNKMQKGINYVKGWLKTLKYLKKNPCDHVHIQWLLRYQIDKFFLRRMKKYTPEIVYTAHNVLPHVDGVKFKQQMSDIYQLVDKIIVHGESSKRELFHYFPEIPRDKVFIQYHGADIREIEDETGGKFDIVPEEAEGKVFLYLGVIFHDKGVERLLEIWRKYGQEYPNDRLIIAGMLTQSEEKYNQLIRTIGHYKNFVYLPKRIENDLHDYLYRRADIIILPYYHASMSGVIFDAALFSKPVLTTSVGCIPEYLENGLDSFVVDNTDEAYEKAFMNILKNVSKETLKQMGCSLHINIYGKYSWKKIAQDLISQVY